MPLSTSDFTFYACGISKEQRHRKKTLPHELKICRLSDIDHSCFIFLSIFILRFLVGWVHTAQSSWPLDFTELRYFLESRGRKDIAFATKRTPTSVLGGNGAFKSPHDPHVLIPRNNMSNIFSGFWCQSGGSCKPQQVLGSRVGFHDTFQPGERKWIANCYIWPCIENTRITPLCEWLKRDQRCLDSRHRKTCITYSVPQKSESVLRFTVLLKLVVSMALL